MEERLISTVLHLVIRNLNIPGSYCDEMELVKKVIMSDSTVI